MKTASQIGIVKKRRSDEATRIAKKLARVIFEMGDANNGDRCQRLQFMVGPWPNERGNGGLCEDALARDLATALRQIQRI